MELTRLEQEEGDTVPGQRGGGCPWARCLVAMLLMAALGVAGLYALARAIGAPWALDRTPAERHLGSDTRGLLREVRSLLRDPRWHGTYWDAEVERRSLRRVQCPEDPVRAVSELPVTLRSLAPLRVRLGPSGATLTWDDDRSYGYGYSLILLPEGADESSMTANNWSFHYTEKIDDGVWSSFSFH